MKKFLFRLFKCSLFICLFYETSNWCEKATKGFAISKISSSFPFTPGWETKKTTEEEKEKAEKALSQTFTYLSQGGQSFVFASEDNQYVLKFFKHHRTRIPFHLNNYLPFFKKKMAQKKKKLERDFQSYKTAFNELSKETGLLYVHLNKTKDLNAKATIIDPLGIKHLIELNQMEFVLQKKAELIYPYIERKIEENNLEEVKSVIQSLIDLIVMRSQKGIFDEDAKLQRNFGVLEGRVVVIDAGRFVKDENRKNREVYKEDLKQITERLKSWLEKHSLELAQFLEEKVNDV